MPLQEDGQQEPTSYMVMLSADDNYTTSYRTLRGNHFSSDIIELSQVFIYHFRKERIGHLYSLRNARGKKLGITPLNMGWYVFGGIGGFKFDPVSDIRNANDWGLTGTHRLQPLGTEGQFLPGSGKEPYSLYSLNIPVGIGMRHSINGDVGLKLEFGYRFTFTDYLDDTSTDFPGWRALEANGSDLAAYYTQPTRTSQSIDYVAYSDNIRGNNGFGERDGYMFLMLTFYFNRDPRHWFDDARRSAVKVENLEHLSKIKQSDKNHIKRRTMCSPFFIYLLYLCSVNTELNYEKEIFN
jgi:hypothetical protein